MKKITVPKRNLKGHNLTYLENLLHKIRIKPKQSCGGKKTELEESGSLEPALRNKRSHHNEKPAHRNEE